MTDRGERPEWGRPRGVIGRSRELGRLAEALRDPGRSPVCLSGPAGSGKSTLALAVVDRVREHLADVGFVDLAGMGRGDALALLAGRLKSLPARRQRPGSGAAWDPALLVVDHAEVLAGVEEDLGRQAGTEGVSLLLLSRTRLSGPSWQDVHLRPLTARESAELLRARAALAGVTLGADSSTSVLVGRLCEVAAGSPLLLELLASRLASIPLARLTSLFAEGRHALDLLSSGDAEAGGARHTLTTSREGSSEDARRLLDALGAFRSSFTHDAMEAVSGLETVALYDALRDLVDLHLVRIDDEGSRDGDGDDKVRYRLPRLVREFVIERQPGEAGQAALVEARDRHADHYGAIASEAARHTRDADDSVATTLLVGDYPEAVSAVLWLEEEQPERALRLALDLGQEALRRGDEVRLMQIVERLLSSSRLTPELRRDACLWLARCALDAIDAESRVERARAWLDEGMELARAHGDADVLLPALMVEAWSLPALHDLARSARAVQEGVELAREKGHQRWMARFEVWSGMVAHVRRDYREAAEWGQRGLRRARECRDPLGVMLATILLTPLPPEADVDRRLLPGLEATLQLTRELRDRRTESAALLMLASQALAQEDHESTARWLRERYALAARWRHWYVMTTQLMVTANLATRQGHPEVAARLHGAIHQHVPAVLAGLPSTLSARYPDALDRARSALGAADFDRSFAEGSLLTLDEATVESMDYLRHADDGDAERDGHGATSGPMASGSSLPTDLTLTAREQEVLGLLVAGRRNKEIAAELFVAPKTVMHHTSSIYRKLGVRGRSEAIVAAVQQGVAAQA